MESTLPPLREHSRRDLHIVENGSRLRPAPNRLAQGHGDQLGHACQEPTSETARPDWTADRAENSAVIRIDFAASSWVLGCT